MGKKLFIGIPVHQTVDPNFFQSMLHFTQENKIPCMMSNLAGDSAVGRARNMITRKFLDSDCDKLLFIDSDLTFSAQHVERLFNHNLDIVAGLYPKKQQGPVQWVINTLDTPGEVLPDKLYEVKYVGTGFLMIDRSVFEKMVKGFGSEIAYISDADHKTVEWDFWHMGVYEYPDGYRRWLSEDWWFCQMARDLGIKIWADGHVILKHTGMVQYPLITQEQEIFRQNQIDPGNTPAAVGDTAFPTAVPAAELSTRQMATA